MPIQANIKPKAGRLAAGAYGGPQPNLRFNGDPFGHTASKNALPAFASDKTTAIVQTNQGGPGNPNARHYDLSTQPPLPGLDNYNNTILGPLMNTKTDSKVPQPKNTLPFIAPHERGTFFEHRWGTMVQKTQFGASGSDASDTAFHPLSREEQETLARPRSARAGERTAAQSFVSTQQMWQDPNNSYAANRTNVVDQGVAGTGRWNVIKRGAAG